MLKERGFACFRPVSYRFEVGEQPVEVVEQAASGVLDPTGVGRLEQIKEVGVKVLLDAVLDNDLQRLADHKYQRLVRAGQCGLFDAQILLRRVAFERHLRREDW